MRWANNRGSANASAALAVSFPSFITGGTEVCVKREKEGKGKGKEET